MTSRRHHPFRRVRCDNFSFFRDAKFNDDFTMHAVRHFLPHHFGQGDGSMFACSLQIRALDAGIVSMPSWSVTSKNSGP